MIDFAGQILMATIDSTIYPIGQTPMMAIDRLINPTGRTLMMAIDGSTDQSRWANSNSDD